MKSFLKKVFLFIFPIVLSAIVIEVTIRLIPNSYKLKSDYLAKNSKKIEVLFLGSSHIFYNINPKYIQANAFNAGNISQSPDIDLAILKNYDFSSLKTLVIRLSYDTLFEQLKIGKENWRLKNYKLYSNLNLEYKFPHNFEILSISLKKNLNTIKEFYFENKDIMGCNEFGFGEKEGAYLVDLENNGLKRAVGHTAENWNLLDINTKIFNTLITYCNTNNIKVILITPPTYKSYYQNLDNKQLRTVINFGEMLDIKYNNCKYYNYLKHPDFEANDFFDSDHLNKSGAKKFSLLINNLLDQ